MGRGFPSDGKKHGRLVRSPMASCQGGLDSYQDYHPHSPSLAIVAYTCLARVLSSTCHKSSIYLKDIPVFLSSSATVSKAFPETVVRLVDAEKAAYCLGGALQALGRTHCLVLLSCFGYVFCLNKC